MAESTQLIGKFLIGMGVAIAVVGVLLLFAPKVPFLGKLPGDLHFKRDNVEIYIPLATSLLISLVLTAGMWLFNYFTKK